MKLLVVVASPDYLRFYESTLRELSRRGHQVSLAINRMEKDKTIRWDHLARGTGSIRVLGKVPSRAGRWGSIARVIRGAMDVLRFFHPRYVDAHALRERMIRKVFGASAARMRVRRLPEALVQLCMSVLAAAERALPCDAATLEFIRSQDPDAVIVTPLVEAASEQVDLIKSAKALGIRTGVCIPSWDNLTNKGLLRVQPQRVFVWNEFQKQEAVEFHGTAASNVVITGTPLFDTWFGRKPSRTYAEFCQAAGLPASRRYVLFVASSGFIAGRGAEVEWVRGWIEALRRSDDPSVRELAVLIRPHPYNTGPWENADFTDLEAVAVWPREQSSAVNARDQDDYFDSLYHSAAVVGINTSAMIEAAIVGKAVHTIAVPEYAGRQQGTLHFHYLVPENGGFVQLSTTLSEHTRALSRTLEDPDAAIKTGEQFLRAFVRPQGLAHASTPLLADAIESLEQLEKPPPEPVPVWGVLLRFPLALAFAGFRGVASLRRRLESVVPRKSQLKGGGVPSKTEKKTRRPKNLLAQFPEVQATKDTIRALGDGDRPIVVGPWITEVGFELLYWIPFLHWAKAYGGIRGDRLIVLSRGGPSHWYRDISPNYRDIFELFEPGTFRTKNDERTAQQGGNLKHVSVSAFDREILAQLGQPSSLNQSQWLHPSLMYNLFRLFWRKQTSVRLIESFSSYRMFAPMETSQDLVGLPDSYVAVKFYDSAAFPDNPRTRQFVSALLENLTRETDVVLLDTGLRVDDHGDFTAAQRDRLHTISHLITPQNNLDVQTQLIANARALVGTYGGFSYLGPLCGVDTVSFYSGQQSFRADHLALARDIFQSLGAGRFIALDLDDLDTLRLGLGADWNLR